MIKSYLKNKSFKTENYDIKKDVDSIEEKKIYKDDTFKKDTLEAKIKEEISKKFYKMFQQSNYSEDDANEVKAFIKKYIKDNMYYFMDSTDYDTFVSTMVNDIFGLGVLENYINDPTINEIWVLGFEDIWYDELGHRKRSNIKFKDDSIVVSMANKILAPINRKVDELNPIVDARLSDGSRVNITFPPIAEHPEIVIRKFNKYKRRLENYVDDMQLTEQMAEFLKKSVEFGANILVVGGTGSGKTSLLNAISSEIPMDQHVITIEDSKELKMDVPFWQAWETKNANSEGVGAVTAQMLVKNSLRNSPDRIVLGEIRDAVAYDVLQAAMTGHKGTMSTIHADDANEAGERFCTLAGSAGVVTADEAKKMFSSTFDLVVVIERLKDPKTDKVLHLITKISHIVGYGEKGASKLKLEKAQDKIYYKDVAYFDKKTNSFEVTGYQPKEMIDKALFENCPYSPDTFLKSSTPLNAEVEEVIQTKKSSSNKQKNKK